MKFKRFLREAELEEEKNKIKQWLRETAREADPAWQPGDKRVDEYFKIADNLEIEPISSFYYSGQENEYGTIIAELPYKFARMSKDFTIIDSDLSSLKNFPAQVDAYVTLNGNSKLKSFVGDLKKCKSLSADDCSIHNLDGLPEIEMNFSIQSAEYLTSFKGSPKKLLGVFAGGFPYVTSLEGLPEQAGSIIINSGGRIKSLAGIHNIVKQCESMHFSGFDSGITEFEGHVLGLLKINGLKTVSGGHGTFSGYKFRKAMEIVDKHLKDKKDIVECQAELIDADLEEYAKL